MAQSLKIRRGATSPSSRRKREFGKEGRRLLNRRAAPLQILTWVSEKFKPSLALCLPLLFLLMKTFFLASLLVATAATATAQEDGEWISLFNGKNLSGWTPKIRGSEAGENYRNTFRVEDGVLKVDYSEYDRWDGEYGHIFHERKLSHYRLRLEYRFTGEQLEGGPGWALRNSGIMIHSESPGTMEKNQEFPVSLEVQLLGGDGESERPTGNLCTPGTHVVMDGQLETRHCINSTSETYHGEQWVTAEVEVRGNDAIRHFINGDEVISYSQPQYDDGDPHGKKRLEAAGSKMISNGYICLQSESHPIEFRNIEVQILDE